MKKNGFTLIELLAVIVILGIIAVITVPVISKTLDDSKKGVAKDSAYGYVEAVNRLYYSNSMNDIDEIADGIYTVSELDNMGVSIDGKKPTEGWVELKDNEVVAFSIKIGKYVITKYSDIDLVVEKRENIKLTQEQEIIAGIYNSVVGNVEDDGAKYLTTAQEIYYNPVTGKVCNGESDSDEYVVANSNVGVLTGCMHWYLYSVKGNYANMLLDHNMSTTSSSSRAWASEDDYKAGLTPIMDGSTVSGYQAGEGIGSKATSAGISYPSTVTSFPVYITVDDNTENEQNARGPVTALNYLKENTSTWKTGTPKVPNSTGINEYIIPASENKNLYQIDYTGYHARLITYTEATYLGCKPSNSGSCPEWMIKGTLGEDASLAANGYGYWTSTPYASTTNAWLVNYNRSMDEYYSVGNFNSNIRPVITVPIVDVLS